MKRFIGSLIGVFVLLLLPCVAHAAYVTDLNISNGSVSSPPFARVTIEEVGNDINFTVDLIGSEYAGEDIEQFGFNPSVTLAAANISGLPSGWSLDTNPGAMDGFGTFGVTVDGGSGVDPLTFSIVGVVGDTIATYATLLSTGDQPDAGQLFAVKTSAAGNAGPFVAGGAAVPIPAALPLFASALALFGFMTRRRRFAAA